MNENKDYLNLDEENVEDSPSINEDVKEEIVESIDENKNNGEQEREVTPLFKPLSEEKRQELIDKEKEKKENSNTIKLIIFVALVVSLFTNMFARSLVLNNSINNTNNNKVNTSNKIEISVTGTTNEVVYNASDIADIVENVMPSMVSITVQTLDSDEIPDEFYYFYGDITEEELEEMFKANGSGIIIGKSETELLIVTNEHVIEDSKNVLITFVDDETIEGHVKGYDIEKDIAIVSIDLVDIPKKTLDSIKIATLGDSNNLRLGESVIAIGNVLGYGETVTDGIVSALNRSVEDEEGVVRTFIQTNADINPGNSGGALFNMKGEVIGINESKISDVAVDGVGFAIPISDAVETIEELIKRETRKPVEESLRGYMGVHIIDVSVEANMYYGMPLGIYVSDVFEAAKELNPNGLQKGDIIYEVDGMGVKSSSKMQDFISFYEAGEVIEVCVYRYNGTDYEEVTLEITLIDKAAFDEVANQ